MLGLLVHPLALHQAMVVATGSSLGRPVLASCGQGLLRVWFEACWLFLAAAVPCCGNASIGLLVHPLALHQAMVVATGSSPGRPVLAS